MTAHTQTLQRTNGEDVEVSYTDDGDGKVILLLHGGAGPQSVGGFGELLRSSYGARVIIPTHPGFGGTTRPETLTTPRELAAIYVSLLEALTVTDVTVIGNSMGGWIASEMALCPTKSIAKLVLIDAGGIHDPALELVDFFTLSMDEVFTLSYHNPDPFRIDPSTMPPAVQAMMGQNRAALTVYGGGQSTDDPTLLARLSGVVVPTLVLWGESDEMMPPAYGRTYANAIPGAKFQLLPGTGHVPQIETPDQLATAIWAFVSAEDHAELHA